MIPTLGPAGVDRAYPAASGGPPGPTGCSGTKRAWWPSEAPAPWRTNSGGNPVARSRVGAGGRGWTGPGAGTIGGDRERSRSIRGRHTGDVRRRPQTRTLGPWDFTEMGSGGTALGSSWSSSRGGFCSGCCPPAAGVPWAAGRECVPDRRRVCRRSRASPLHPQEWLNPGPVPRTPGYPLVGWQIRQESTTSAIGRGQSGPST
jgi:hypothetical protein